MSTLILESITQCTNVAEIKTQKTPPSSRNILRAIPALYKKGGISLLFNGLIYACTFWLKHYVITQALGTFLPSPLASIITSILLAETRFLWTARKVLAPDQIRILSSSSASACNLQRWKALIGPTLIYSIVERFMVYVPRMYGEGPSGGRTFIFQHSVAEQREFIQADILVAALMLFAQFLLFLPAGAMLTIVHASHLPASCETLVISQGRGQKGKRIGEVFATVDRRPVSLMQAFRMVGKKQILACSQLHGQMCLCLVVLSTCVHTAIVFFLV